MEAQPSQDAPDTHNDCSKCTHKEPCCLGEELQNHKQSVEDILKTLSSADMLTPEGVSAVTESLNRLSVETNHLLTTAFAAANASAAHPPARKFSLAGIADAHKRSYDSPLYYRTSTYFNNLRNTADVVKPGRGYEIVRHCMLLGYTFDMAFQAEKTEENETVVRFVLFVHSGFWDDMVTWPIDKKISMVLLHPTCPDKNKTFPTEVAADLLHSYFKKPEIDISNEGLVCAELNWEELKREGFVSTDAISIDILFH